MSNISLQNAQKASDFIVKHKICDKNLVSISSNQYEVRVHIEPHTFRLLFKDLSPRVFHWQGSIHKEIIVDGVKVTAIFPGRIFEDE
jgi:hypothetical protein